MNKFRNKIVLFLLSSPILFGLGKVLAANEIEMVGIEDDGNIPEIDMIDIDNGSIPEMEPELMPDLPQIEEVENNVANSATAFFNEHTLLVIIALLVLVLLIVFVVIFIMAKGKKTPTPSVSKSSVKEVTPPEGVNAKDLSSAVKSFLIRTEIIR